MSTYDCRTIFGQNIKRLREERNMSLDELSEKTGINKKYLIRIEQGTAKMLFLRHIEIFSKAFKVDSKELFKE